MALHRRTVLKGLGASTAVVSMPCVARAQTGPMRVGFLTVKTAPLASGGLQMEQGLTLYLKERNNMLAGRPVQLFTGDSAGGGAGGRPHTKEEGGGGSGSSLSRPRAAPPAQRHPRRKQAPALAAPRRAAPPPGEGNPGFRPPAPAPPAPKGRD